LLEGVAHGGPGGVGDLFLLLALQIVAVQLPRLVVAILTIVDVSYSAGVTGLLNTVAESLLLPVIAVLAAAILMGRLTRGYAGRERNLDLAALSVTPAICVQLAGSLAAAIANRRPPRWTALVVLALGALWFIVLVGISVRAVRGSDRSDGSGGR
jgi:hypothetical protein